MTYHGSMSKSKTKVLRYCLTWTYSALLSVVFTFIPPPNNNHQSPKKKLLKRNSFTSQANKHVSTAKNIYNSLKRKTEYLISFASQPHQEVIGLYITVKKPFRVHEFNSLNLHIKKITTAETWKKITPCKESVKMGSILTNWSASSKTVFKENFLLQ